MPAARTSRWFRRLALALAAVVGLVVVAVIALVLLVDSNAVTQRVLALVVPRASAALGREVVVGGARLSLLPDTRVHLQDFRIAGRPGEPPLASAASLDVEVGLWPLLRSLGKDIDVRAIELVSPVVNLVREQDGTWSHEGLGQSGGAAPAPEPPARAGGSASRVAVRELSITDATVRLIDRGTGARGASGPDEGIALSRLDLRATGIGPGLPLDARLSAALGPQQAGAVQDIHAELSLAALPRGVPARPQDWPAVTGALRIGGLSLEAVRALLPAALGEIVRGGRVSLDARISTAGGAYVVDGDGQLADLSLRGQPASGKFRARATLPLGRFAAGRVDVSDLSVRGPGVDLGGHASAQLTPLRATFVVTGPLLDLDAVMGVLPASKAPAPAKPAAGGDGGLLPASLRGQVQAARASGTIAVERLRAGRLDATDVRARATLQGGVLLLDELQAAAFGGRVDGAGTRVDLGAPVPAWRLAAKLSGLDLAAATKAFGGASPLAGALDGRLDLSGQGTAWDQVRTAANGLAELALKDGALTTADLGAPVREGIAKALRAAGRSGAAGQVSGAGGRTAIRDLAGRFEVKDGFLGARSPFAFQAPFGKVTLGGRLGLDGRLDLQGQAAVPREALSGLAPAAALPASLEVPLRLGGTLASPSVGVDAGGAVAAAVKGQSNQAAGAARDKAERAGRRAVGDVLKGLGGRRK